VPAFTLFAIGNLFLVRKKADGMRDESTQRPPNRRKSGLNREMRLQTSHLFAPQSDQTVISWRSEPVYQTFLRSIESGQAQSNKECFSTEFRPSCRMPDPQKSDLRPFLKGLPQDIAARLAVSRAFWVDFDWYGQKGRLKRRAFQRAPLISLSIHRALAQPHNPLICIIRNCLSHFNFHLPPVFRPLPVL